jgi:hypothetical protein
MRSFPARVSVLPADWTATLARIQDDLAQALAGAEQRWRELDAGLPSPDPTSVPEVSALFPLEQLDACLHRFQSCLEEAERQAVEADLWFQGNQEAVERWLERVQSVGQRLMEPEAHSIE